MAEASNNLTRRTLLRRAAAGAAAATGLDLTAGQTTNGKEPDDLEKYDFLLPRVKFRPEEGPEDYWSVYYEGDRNLLRAFSSVIRCKVKLKADCRGQSEPECRFNAVVEFDDFETLRKHPFLFMTSQYHYKLNATEKKNLKRYIETGGFLLMDDCISQSRGVFFYQSSYELLEEVFGKPALRPIPHEHEVFHNVYDFGEGGVPHCYGTYHRAKGVFVDDRLAVFLSSTDIHCAWVGNHRLVKEGTHMGVNILMYALSH